METLGSLRRTNYCGEVTLAMAGQEMTVCGSIARARDKGGIIFADLRDTTGILQLVFESYFNSTHQNFTDRLRQRYSDLTTGDLRICCLLRMNLSTKEIAGTEGERIRNDSCRKDSFRGFRNARPLRSL